MTINERAQYIHDKTVDTILECAQILLTAECHADAAKMLEIMYKITILAYNSDALTPQEFDTLHSKVYYCFAEATDRINRIED